MREKFVLLCLAIVLSACGSNAGTQSTVTVTQSSLSQSTFAEPTPVEPTSTAPVVSSVSLPDVTGMNAELAQQKLEGLGLTNVELASANPKYSMVLLARNWSVTSMDPAAGTTVKSSDSVILKVYKE